MALLILSGSASATCKPPNLTSNVNEDSYQFVMSQSSRAAIKTPAELDAVYRQGRAKIDAAYQRGLVKEALDWRKMRTEIWEAVAD